MIIELCTILTFLTPLPSVAISSGTHIIEAGREAEIESLFSGIGQGNTAGWQVPDIEIPKDRIRAHLSGPHGEKLVIELRDNQGRKDAAGSTPSFELFVVSSHGLDDQARTLLVRNVAQAIANKDDGEFWHLIASPAANLSPSRPNPWFSSLGALATLAWMAAFWSLLILGLVFALRRKPWKEPEQRRILIEIAVLTIAAFIIRQWLMIPGPGQMVSRLPEPSAPPSGYPQFGCGFGGWILGWFWIFGSDDKIAFMAGAVAGALTVIPVYFLAWFGSGSRWAGLAAGAAMVLWPIHARLSPTDDAGGLIALLLISSLALVISSGRFKSGSLLFLGWLAGCLAATTRPEMSLALLPLGVIVLITPSIRKIQFRPLVLAPTILLGLLTCMAVYTASIEAMSGGFSPLFCATNSEARGLFDLFGGRSILAPPRTPWPFTVLFLAGLVVSLFRTRGRTILWLCIGLLPALPTACFSRTDIVTARYQLQLVPLGATLAGMCVAWLWEAMLRIRPRFGSFLVILAASAAAVIAAKPLVFRPLEPTFKLEYRFFRENIGKVPAGCRIVRISWPYGDIGLRVPTYLTRLLGLDLSWVEPSAELDPSKGCLAYWQPASCRAWSQSLKSATWAVMPECLAIESAFRLDPIATTGLPSRPEFCDNYRIDPVPVGFYRLLPKTAASDAISP
jgi:hypothetical protein